jgi:uncharacterized repeat protein (TIGR02543 family)
MKKIKKFMSVLLALIIVLAAVPIASVTAHAATQVEQILSYASNIAATNPHKYDGLCLAFVDDCYISAGYAPQRKATAYIAGNEWITSTSSTDIPVGAMVFFDLSWHSTAGHVGIYAGNGKMYDAESQYGGVKLRNFTTKGYRGWGWYGGIAPTGSSGGGSTPETCNCSTSYAGDYTVTVGDAYVLYLRANHNTSGSPLANIPNGTTLHVTKGNGSWAHTSYAGIEGYVSMSWLTKQTHTCSYKSYFEAAHPHKKFMKCSCGNKYYTGENKILSTCSSCIAENTIELYASKYSVNLTIGGTESTTIQVWTEGKYSKPTYLSLGTNTDIVKGEWGKDGYITLTAQGKGTTQLTINIVDDATDKVLDSVVVDVTVTAKKYTVSYDANGGSGAPSCQTKTHGKTLKLNSTVPTRSGYTFLGWSPSSTATIATYSAGGKFTLNANVTLYAVWSKNPDIPSTDGDYDYGFHIQTPSRTTIRNQDTIVLHVKVDDELPEGYSVKWEGSSGNFSRGLRNGDKTKLYATAEDNGSDTITAILYDAAGNELARDSVELYSDSGFFQKIGGFFRMIFGTTITYEY